MAAQMETFPRFSLIPIVIGGWLEICHVPPIIASLPAAKRILHKEALAMAKRNSFWKYRGYVRHFFQKDSFKGLGSAIY